MFIETRLITNNSDSLEEKWLVVHPVACAARESANHGAAK